LVRFDPTIRALDDFSRAPVYLPVRDGQLLVGPPQAPWPAAAPRGEQFMIGSLDGRAVVAVRAEGEDGAGPGREWLGLRQLHGRVSEHWWTIAGRALQIVEWDHTHRFCGRCATATERMPGENARRCPRCGLIVYPRLSPAVIVLVTRGTDDGEALLVWGQRWERPFYSTIAGFVEPGETLEHAVVREVREETGIEVTDVSYFASQPWPFPNQLMIGFYARYASGEIALQTSEVREARWITPAQLDELPSSRGPLSISGWLIEGWVTRGAQPRDWFL
jgi:NAD+ diphosphatase